MTPLLFSPHNDDFALFASFTVLRERPHLITVFDSFVQPARGYYGCGAAERRAEDEAAAKILGQDRVHFLGVPDDGSTSLFSALEECKQITEETYDGGEKRAWLPLWETDGHHHHNLVTSTVHEIFQGWKFRYYTTYTRHGRTTSGVRVAFEHDWARLKLQALACYASQIRLADNVEHFLGDQHEYMVG